MIIQMMTRRMDSLKIRITRHRRKIFKNKGNNSTTGKYGTDEDVESNYILHLPTQIEHLDNVVQALLFCSIKS